MGEPEPGLSFIAPEPTEVGSLFPQYDVHALIACGGMGAVYQATQRSLDRPVAIKILPREFSKDDAFRIGFEAEAKAMAKLNHPNLIGVYDFGEVDGMLFIVMEYVAGKSLFHSAHGKSLEQGEAMRVVAGVCHGLAHAHEHGILHRDIKPGNILLDENANPKIGDFGLARALESEVGEGDQIFGTPGYTAPEVIEPPFTFDHRADIFSVGVMLHELLTGSTPGADTPSGPQRNVPNLRINAIIQKATNPDPKLRFPSALELAESLEKIAKAQGKSVAAPQRPMSRPKQHMGATTARKSSPVGIVVFLLLGVAAAATLYLSKKQKLDEAVEDPKNVTPTVVVVPAPLPDSAPDSGQKPPESGSPSLGMANPVERAPEVQQDGKPDVGMPVPDQTTPLTEDIASADSEEPAGNTGEPEHDGDIFLKKARVIMKEKASADIDAYKEALAGNTDAFEKKLRLFVIDHFESGSRRVQANLDTQYEIWKEKGYRIPKGLPRPFRDLDEVLEMQSEFLEVQTGIEENFALILQEHSSTYVTGIKYQIQRLVAASDEPGIAFLKGEIEHVESAPEYFTDLMLN